MPKVAVVQMTSGADFDANLRAMESAVAEAAQRGAAAVAFPEMAYLMAPKEVWAPLLPRYDEMVGTFSSWAAKHRLALLAGSVREPIPGEEARCYNTSLFFSSDGKLAAKYRKIFLFRATLPDRGYDEGQHTGAGAEVVSVPSSELGHVGLSICFDVRFPELFRVLRRRGAQIVFVPSAFTVPTGTAHWHALLRARAIENQVFVVAPAQTGTVGNGAKTFGHSLVVAPWGEVVLDAGEAPGIFEVSLDLAAIAEAEAKVPALVCRRDDLFFRSSNS